MAVTAKIFSATPLRAFEKYIDLDSDTTKCMLCTSSYTPNQVVDAWRSSVTNEVEGTGYTAGGATITNTSVSTSDLVTKFDGDDVQWENSTITARYAVLYLSDVLSFPLLCYVDFGEDKSSINGLFKIEWHAHGIFKITVS